MSGTDSERRSKEARGGSHAATFGAEGPASQTKRPGASLSEFSPVTAAVPCDFCGSTDFEFFCHKMRNGINLRTVACKRCALVQTNPQPTADCLRTFYERFYHLFHQRTGVDQSYLAKSRPMAQRRFARVAQHLDPASPASVLEVGPGAGEFLACCRRRSAWSALGLEPGTESFRHCAERGLNVVQTGIESFESPERYSLIAAFNVMDHLRSPKAFLEKCHRLSADAGLLALEVVNLNRFAHPRQQMLQFPLLYVFNYVSLTNLLQQCGFRPIFIDDTSPTLMIISRRTDDPPPADFIHVDLTQHLRNLNRKDRVVRLATWLPSFSIFGRLRSLLSSFSS